MSSQNISSAIALRVATPTKALAIIIAKHAKGHWCLSSQKCIDMSHLDQRLNGPLRQSSKKGIAVYHFKGTFKTVIPKEH